MDLKNLNYDPTRLGDPDYFTEDMTNAGYAFMDAVVELTRIRNVEGVASRNYAEAAKTVADIADAIRPFTNEESFEELIDQAETYANDTNARLAEIDDQLRSYI